MKTSPFPVNISHLTMWTSHWRWWLYLKVLILGDDGHWICCWIALWKLSHIIWDTMQAFTVLFLCKSWSVRVIHLAVCSWAMLIIIQRGGANAVSIQPGTCTKYKSIYSDFHFIPPEIDFPYQCLMFKGELIIGSTCYWELCRTHSSEKPLNLDDDYTV